MDLRGVERRFCQKPGSGADPAEGKMSLTGEVAIERICMGLWIDADQVEVDRPNTGRKGGGFSSHYPQSRC